MQEKILKREMIQIGLYIHLSWLDDEGKVKMGTRPVHMNTLTNPCSTYSSKKESLLDGAIYITCKFKSKKRN